MSPSDRNDPRWNAAWDWLIREHEQELLDAAAYAELTAWLRADPANLESYQQARRIWQAARLATKFSRGPLVN